MTLLNNHSHVQAKAGPVRHMAEAEGWQSEADAVPPPVAAAGRST